MRFWEWYNINMKVLIQAGHENTTTGQTGAPEERANNIRIRNRLGQILISKGFQVFLCDANFKSQDNFNLALALHCDANYAGNEGGGFVDYPDADLDGNNAESKRIKEAIESEYFKNSGIRNVPSQTLKDIIGGATCHRLHLA
jgi:N-acetylmuramoyl-L-alanine amidase